jgi:hypothetical protein
VAIGLFPQELLEVAGRAGDQLLDPAAYRAAVGVVVEGGTP